MPQLEVRLGASPALVVLAIGVAIVLAWLFYRSTLPPVAPLRRRLLLLLRASVLVLLVLALVDPIIRLISTTTTPPVLTLLVDNSRSMTVVDRLGDRSQQVRTLLESPALRTLASRTDLRTFSFGTSVRPVADENLDSLHFDEDGTDIAAALANSLGPGSRGAALLMSDGVFTLGQNPVHAAENVLIPLYTVGIGDSSEQRDVVITHISSNAIVYSGTTVPVEVLIKGAGVGGQRVDISLLDGGTVLDRTSLNFEEGTREYSVSLSYTPSTDGLRSLTVTASSVAGELTTKNNRRTFTVRVRKSKLHILLLAGSPSHDVALIRQTLAEQPQFAVTSYTQNPSGGFYEGTFRLQDLDSADCLVVSGFPTATTAPAMNERLLAALQARRLPLFFQVTRETDWRRIGAWFSFLPFTVETPSFAEQEIACEATVAEHSMPLVTPARSDGTDPWTALPPVFATRSVFRPRPKARVLVAAQVTGLTGPAPVLVARNLQDRRVLALAAHGVWRWRLMAQRSPLTRRFFTEFLRNALLWLTTPEETGPVIARPLKELFAAGEPLAFEAQVYDARQQPVGDAEVELVLQGATDNTREAVLTPRPGGRYSAELQGIGDEGTYRYRVTARRGGQTLGADSGRVAVGGTAIEFLNTRMDLATLRRLAERTGGKFLLPADIGRLDSLLDHSPSFAPVVTTSASEITLRNWPWLVAAIVLLLAVEWFLRKRSGMI